jgi:hypothetical protein
LNIEGQQKQARRKFDVVIASGGCQVSEFCTLNAYMKRLQTIALFSSIWQLQRQRLV